MISRRIMHFFIVICLCFFSIQQDIVCQDKPTLAWKYKPEKVRIEDNLSFIFHRDTSSEVTSLRIFFNGGKKAEPKSMKGLTFLTTRLCIEISNQSDTKKFMDLGSSFSVLVKGDCSIINVKCLSENLEDTLKILTGILRKPLFSALRISHIKKYMKYQQNIEDNNTEKLLAREYFNAFFGNESYGGSIFGDSDSLKRIKKKHIVDFYKKFFNLSNMVITISSDLNKSEIAEVLKKNFHSFPRGEKHLKLSAVEKRILEKEDYFFGKEKKQTLVSLAVLLPEMTPQQFTCAYMLEGILGGGMGSKLWPLRAIKSLAYTLMAKVTYMKDAGILCVYLKTDTSKKEKALQSLKEVITDLYKSGVTEREFAVAKVYSSVRFLRHNETKESRTFNMGFLESIGPGFEFLEDFFSHVDSMKIENLNAYIKEVLKPAGLVKIIIGPDE